MKIVSSFGERIKLYREDNKYTLAEMERLTGVPAPTLNRYELGQRIPKVDSATLIAHKLQINPLWLFGYDVENVPVINNSPSLEVQIEQEYGKNTAAALNLYVQLDESDQIRITERITVLLEDEKYSSDSVLLAARGGKIKLDKKTAEALARSANEAPNSSQDKDMF